DDGGAVADGVEGGGEELELLLVRQRRRLAGRAEDDDAVAAVLDQVPRQLAEPPVVDGAVRLERRDDRRQDLAEHSLIVLGKPARGATEAARGRPSAPGAAPAASRARAARPARTPRARGCRGGSSAADPARRRAPPGA